MTWKSALEAKLSRFKSREEALKAFDFLQGEWTNSQNDGETYLVNGTTARRTNSHGVRTFRDHLVWEEKWHTIAWGPTRRYYLDKFRPHDKEVQWTSYNGGKPFRWTRPASFVGPDSAAQEKEGQKDPEIKALPPKPKARPKTKANSAEVTKQEPEDGKTVEEKPKAPAKRKVNAKPKLMTSKPKAAAAPQPPAEQGPEAKEEEEQKEESIEIVDSPEAEYGSPELGSTEATHPHPAGLVVALSSTTPSKEAAPDAVTKSGRGADSAAAFVPDYLGAEPGWEKERLLARSLLAQGFRPKPDPEDSAVDPLQRSLEDLLLFNESDLMPEAKRQRIGQAQ